MNDKSPTTPRQKSTRRAVRRGKGGRPKYCGPHKASGLAYVWHGGRQVYFAGSPYGSRDSLEQYDRWCSENVERKTPRPSRNPPISALVLAFLDHAEAYYGESAEFAAYKSVGMALYRFTGETRVDEFGPRLMKAFRAKIVADGYLVGPEIGPKENRSYTRSYVNHQMQRLVRMFKWGVSEEIVAPATLESLRSVEGLRKGKTDAVDRDPVQPVDPAHVDAVVAVVSPTVAAMIRIHQLTGMRSENVCQMRPCDIDRSDPDVWTYIPAKHKTDWLGKRLFVPLGPRCRAILEPLLDRDDDAYLFSPRESAAWVAEQRRINRKTPASPSHRRRKRRPHRRYRDAYDRSSYRQAIVRAIDKANKQRGEWNAAHPDEPPLESVPHWHPHQLRHHASTTVRRTHGAEAARVYLSHASLDASEIYAERDVDLAKRIAREIG